MSGRAGTSCFFVVGAVVPVVCIGRCGVPVAESALAPPGPIPNPVVTRRSAGEYCGGDPVGGEAAAGAPHRRIPHRQTRRGVEQWQLVGLITQRSEVRILPPLPDPPAPRASPHRGPFAAPPYFECPG